MPFLHLSIRQLFHLACIAGFPLFVLFVVTTGFVDVLPLFENPDTGMTLLYTGFLYLIISLFLRRRPAYLFYGVYLTAIGTLLAGVAAYFYYWHFVPGPLEIYDIPRITPPGWGLRYRAL
ncbi:hypothetical protein [Chitinophaga arvensicola]|uniref:Uncharacterized protein n=1 Tax=Chitinophaga arvensicola TaxID=29529 RepID=A0A1I0SDY3_9BACT|nr:hypothetical protein [Chitinophaga arvensicola]SEW57381.1 hypothetical protein SAMN04488122_6763 [Chitinophaga arvensicola]